MPCRDAPIETTLADEVESDHFQCTAWPGPSSSLDYAVLLDRLSQPLSRSRRCRAPMEYLAHSASFHSFVKHAPSKPGIKHLDNQQLRLRRS